MPHPSSPHVVCAGAAFGKHESAAPSFAVFEGWELDSLHRILGSRCKSVLCCTGYSTHTLLPAKDMPELVPLSPQIILSMRAGRHFARHALNHPDSGSFKRRNFLRII